MKLLDLHLFTPSIKGRWREHSARSGSLHRSCLSPFFTCFFTSKMPPPTSFPLFLSLLLRLLIHLFLPVLLLLSFVRGLHLPPVKCIIIRRVVYSPLLVTTRTLQSIQMRKTTLPHNYYPCSKHRTLSLAHTYTHNCSFVFSALFAPSALTGAEI